MQSKIPFALFLFVTSTIAIIDIADLQTLMMAGESQTIGYTEASPDLQVTFQLILKGDSGFGVRYLGVSQPDGPNGTFTFTPEVDWSTSNKYELTAFQVVNDTISESHTFHDITIICGDILNRASTSSVFKDSTAALNSSTSKSQASTAPKTPTSSQTLSTGAAVAVGIAIMLILIGVAGTTCFIYYRWQAKKNRFQGELDLGPHKGADMMRFEGEGLCNASLIRNEKDRRSLAKGLNTKAKAREMDRRSRVTMYGLAGTWI